MSKKKLPQRVRCGYCLRLVDKEDTILCKVCGVKGCVGTDGCVEKGRLWHCHNCEEVPYNA